MKLLITSRERLNLQTEWASRLSHALQKNLATQPADALKLFGQMAQRAQADFVLTAESQPTSPKFAKLWRRAARHRARLRLGSPAYCAEIAQELAQGIGFLQTQAGDVPDRHRSLQAVFDHSWALLTQKSKRRWRSLLCSVQALRVRLRRQVTGASLWTLTALVDKSLLHRETNGRYNMLEMVRQFAATPISLDAR